MYASKANGHRTKVRKQCNSRVLRIMNLNGW